MRILLLHARRSAYGAVRSLHGRVDELIVADHEATPLRRSKLIDAFHRIPDVSTSRPEAVVAAIRHIIDEDAGTPTVILAAKDDYLQLLSERRDDLGPSARFGQEVDADVIARVLDKAALPGLAHAAGVGVPATVVDRIEDIADLRPPLVVKPALKRVVGLDVERAAFRLRLCRSIRSAQDAAAALQALGVRFVAQEVVGGPQPRLHTVGLVARAGTVVAAATAMKVRQFPPSFGECALGITTERPDLIEVADRLVRASGLSGLAQIEFIETDEGPLLIEINPRLWSWHDIHAAAGVDLVRIAVDEAMRAGGWGPPSSTSMTSAPRIPGQAVGVRWQFLAMDLLHNAGRQAPLREVLRDGRAVEAAAFRDPRDRVVGRAHGLQTLRNLPGLLRTTVRRPRHELEGVDGPV